MATNTGPDLRAVPLQQRMVLYHDRRLLSRLPLQTLHPLRVLVQPMMSLRHGLTYVTPTELWGDNNTAEEVEESWGFLP